MKKKKTESETEESSVVIDGEAESKQGDWFYHVLDCKHKNLSDDEEYLDDKPEVTSPEPEKIKNHPLKKLR